LLKMRLREIEISVHQVLLRGAPMNRGDEAISKVGAEIASLRSQ